MESNIGRRLRRPAAVLATALLAVLPLVPAQGQDEDPVLDRQLVMQALEKQSEALGMIVAGSMPADQMPQRTAEIAKLAREARDSFKAKAPGGAAKPEIWSNWEDYSRRMDAFVANTEKMAEAAKTGSVPQVTEMLVDALPCKSCHDVYRAKRE